MSIPGSGLSAIVTRKAGPMDWHGFSGCFHGLDLMAFNPTSSLLWTEVRSLVASPGSKSMS